MIPFGGPFRIWIRQADAACPVSLRSCVIELRGLEAMRRRPGPDPRNGASVSKLDGRPGPRSVRVDTVLRLHYRPRGSGLVDH
jgi:hypothetical protein